MRFHILGSGSKGNSTIIQSDNINILIDCGLTQKYTLACFDELNYKLEDLNALLITHEHIDHIRQIKMFKDLDIYSPSYIEDINTNIIHPYEAFNIGSVNILPLELSHDCDICVGYLFDDDKESLAYIGDTGIIDKKNESLIRNKTYYIIESNYDYDMLNNSKRPEILKRRIMSNNGHMDNIDTASILKRIVGKKTKEIVLAHISTECNDYDLAKNIVEKELNNKNIIVRAAKQYEILSKLN